MRIGVLLALVSSLLAVTQAVPYQLEETEAGPQPSHQVSLTDHRPTTSTVLGIDPSLIARVRYGRDRTPPPNQELLDIFAPDSTSQQQLLQPEKIVIVETHRHREAPRQPYFAELHLSRFTKRIVWDSVPEWKMLLGKRVYYKKQPATIRQGITAHHLNDGI